MIRPEDLCKESAVILKYLWDDHANITQVPRFDPYVHDFISPFEGCSL
jgi:hypothetical protein